MAHQWRYFKNPQTIKVNITKNQCHFPRISSITLHTHSLELECWGLVWCLFEHIRLQWLCQTVITSASSRPFGSNTDILLRSCHWRIWCRWMLVGHIVSTGLKKCCKPLRVFFADYGFLFQLPGSNVKFKHKMPQEHCHLGWRITSTRYKRSCIRSHREAHHVARVSRERRRLLTSLDVP